MSTTVHHVRDVGRRGKDKVYIGRPSIWGNPFVVGVHGARTECVERYEEWLNENPLLLAKLPELKDKKLVCFCAPRPCHGDVLARLVDAL